LFLEHAFEKFTRLKCAITKSEPKANPGLTLISHK
jgi:hypothetical protein